ncbi:Mitochondrial import inner membrane translocase subunit TIM9 [Smittium culicis]|uniref:Mitochondrial import inner membrane translocase subunit n=1 Tax=Smittium culicis TaxID=133412 RepID=A0A1R1XA20_9FUNG|nr:Mitochondrial import inner membrane translocase subunit TIM9 [Smittium culicis]
MFGGIGRNQPAQDYQLQAMLEQKQVKDFMKMYSNLVARCFNDCVTSFDEKSLTERESTCSKNCANKFMKHNERLGARFAEENQALMEDQARK